MLYNTKFLYLIFYMVDQVSINPNKGVLPPLASCSVDVVFRALNCHHFDSVLLLTVLNGTGW